MEFKLIELSPEDKRDYQLESILAGAVELPEVLDTRPSLLPIRNQGIQGSCVAESSAAMKERQEYKDAGFRDYFSPQFIYNLRDNKGQEGMFPRNAMDILRNIGIVAEEDYPYGKIESLPDAPADLKTKADNFRIDSYAYVNTIDGLKQAIMANGAAIFCVPVYDYGTQMWKAKTLGQAVLGYHAIAAIGWNKEGFILRNSWGATWGDKGYTIFPYSDWGMQSEIWSAIDNLGSKKEDKHNKWWLILWTAILNVHKNLFPTIFLYEGMILMGVLAAIQRPTVLIFVILSVAITVLGYYIRKNKFYLPRVK